MSIADAAQSIVDILGSNQGTISLGVAAAVAMGSPLVDRLLIRRKRVQYQVLYNSKIGLSPVLLGSDGDDPPSVPTNPQLDHLAELLEYLSVVIVRIRNTGSYDITESDFEPPLSFTFGSRVVWDARVSEASDPQLRRHIRENMEFFNRDPVGAPKRTAETAGEDYRNLPTLRRWLAPRLSAWLTPATSSVLVDSAEPQWHGVRLARLWLRRKQSFILVVVLRETNSDAAEITKDYRVTGGHSTGKTIIDERRQRRFGWPVVATAIGVLLVGALLATLIVGHGRQAIPGCPARGGPCAWRAPARSGRSCRRWATSTRPSVRAHTSTSTRAAVSTASVTSARCRECCPTVPSTSRHAGWPGNWSRCSSTACSSTAASASTVSRAISSAESTAGAIRTGRSWAVRRCRSGWSAVARGRAPAGRSRSSCSTARRVSCRRTPA